jgi:hypothetical protein
LCHTCCDTGPRFFRSRQKDRPIQSPLTTHKGMWRIYSNPDPHRSPFSRLLRHTMGFGGPIRTRILTGCNNRSRQDNESPVIRTSLLRCFAMVPPVLASVLMAHSSEQVDAGCTIHKNERYGLCHAKFLATTLSNLPYRGIY